MHNNWRFGPDFILETAEKNGEYLRISTPAIEGVYQGSKYLKFQILCDAQELQGLFTIPFSIYPLTGVGDGKAISSGDFLNAYGSWIEGLKKGKLPTDAELRKVLACAWTAEEDALWKQEVGAGRYLVKLAKPTVQVQAHYFTYSPIDGMFRPMTMGANAIFWGLQLSYPQIYQNPKTMELMEVGDSPNSLLFDAIRVWVRNATRAMPFVVEGKRTNVPMRLGKNCFQWIQNHPQLVQQKIGIYAD